MKYVGIDCEFVPSNLGPSGLISIGVATEGKEYYAVNADMDGWDAASKDWMKENVLRHIPGRVTHRRKKWYSRRPEAFFSVDQPHRHRDIKMYDQIRDEMDAFFEGLCSTGKAKRDIRLVAWCGAQDMIRLHTLWDNDWGIMPKWIPRHFDDIESMIRDSKVDEATLPPQSTATQHHALHDAKHDLEIVRFLMGHTKT